MTAVLTRPTERKEFIPDAWTPNPDAAAITVTEARIDQAVAAYVANRAEEGIRIEPSDDLREAIFTFLDQLIDAVIENPAKYAEKLCANTDAGRRFDRCRSCWEKETF